MTEQWSILLVEDDRDLGRTTQRRLMRRLADRDAEVVVDHLTDFGEALAVLKEGRHDLAVLDIRDQSVADSSGVPEGADGDEATDADLGLRVFDQVRQQRFVPIVFYSAVSRLADPLCNPPFVQVIHKLAENAEDELIEAVLAVLDSPLPELHRSILQKFEVVFRTFMIDFVEKNWEALDPQSGSPDIDALLLRRLARSLDEATTNQTDAMQVDPTRLYVMPPIGELTTGDVVEFGGGWGIVLTPACDLVAHGAKPAQAERIVVAACSELSEFEEYAQWKTDPTKSGKLLRLLRNASMERQRDRYFFLPGAWRQPDLMVDLQDIHSLDSKDVKGILRHSTLDHPYAQALASQLSRYFGRTGTPDINFTAVLERLQEN